MYPDGENAVELYQRVLAAEPGNAAATQGLNEIADYYLKQARALCDRTLWSQCHEIAGNGLKARPEDADLKALRDEAGKKAIGG